jgi:DNA replication protein DnaC
MSDKEIGHYKYKSIINKSELTDKEKRQIKKYETDRGLSPEQKAKVAEYFQNLDKGKLKMPDKANVNLSVLYKQFLPFYKQVEGEEFNPKLNGGESKLLVFTLLSYFFKHPKFYDSPLVNSEITNPDLKKGLLMIGPSGNSKTTVMIAIKKMVDSACGNDLGYTLNENNERVPLKYYYPSFSFETTQSVVQRMDDIKKDKTEKESLFFSRYKKGTHYLDDLMKEGFSKMFGQTNVVGEIIRYVYDNNSRLIASINPIGDTSETLLALGEHYAIKKEYNHQDAYVYDRLFKMFNIIELKGTSLRK